MVDFPGQRFGDDMHHGREKADIQQQPMLLNTRNPSASSGSFVDGRTSTTSQKMGTQPESRDRVTRDLDGRSEPLGSYTLL